MTARFRRKDDTVEAGVRRIALDEIDRAITAIDAVDRTTERKVHDVRQQCKKLRALIRLVRPALTGFDVMDTEFRAIARSLSGARDAKVTIETFDLLTQAGGKRLDDIDIAAIRRRLEIALRRHAGPGDKLSACRARLVEARAQVKHWTLAEADWAAIAGGLARTYRRARRAMAEAAVETDPHASHVWRKHAKYHWHHVRLLQAIQPRRLRDRAKDADKLGTSNNPVI